MSESLQIANTTLSQIGGTGRLRAMIGAKDFVALSANDKRTGGVQFSLPAFGKPKINKIVIELMPSDTYTVTFYFIRKVKGSLAAKMVAYADNVYCDGLRECIERNTGLYLSLGRAA